MKFVGRVSTASLSDGAMVRLAYPPFDALVTLVDGKPFAIEDACNHAGASLSEGQRRDECVACPMHGYTFNLRSGRLIEPRGLCADQRSFLAWVDGTDVLVWDPGAGAAILGT